MNHSNDFVIIMAGGVGTRFWPMSRRSLPKQFLDILNTGRTLIQDTFDRFNDFIPSENIYVVTNDQYFDLVQQQLPKLAPDQILLEPIGRDTAPCVAYACYKIQQRNAQANFVVAPADHLIENREVFQKNIELGLEAINKKDIIMTLGITPTRPDTGYGYIQYMTDDLGLGYHRVKTFTEKPTLKVAQNFLESGEFLWNGGIFLFSSSTIFDAFQSFLPDTAELFEDISSTYYTQDEKEAIRQVYATCKPISMDYGIMEKADNVFTIPSDFGWSDLGTWGSVHANSHKDESYNASNGLTKLYNASGNMIHVNNPKKIVVVKGAENFLIIDTEDALLICNKEDEQFIKQIVTDLRIHYDDLYT